MKLGACHTGYPCEVCLHRKNSVIPGITTVTVEAIQTAANQLGEQVVYSLRRGSGYFATRTSPFRLSVNKR